MRISDWSSDVCSSDLKLHDFCNRAVLFSLPMPRRVTKAMGPKLLSWMDGASLVKVERLSKPLFVSASPPSADMAIGTFCTFSLRFWAVTTMSSIWLTGVADWSAAADCWAKAGLHKAAVEAISRDAAPAILRELDF